jgi:hypothetical protein
VKIFVGNSAVLVLQQMPIVIYVISVQYIDLLENIVSVFVRFLMGSDTSRKKNSGNGQYKGRLG